MRLAALGPQRPGLWLGLCLAVGLLGQTRASAQESAPLARYLPSEGLYAYVEFEGLDAHSAAWKKTSAYRLLNETTCGVMLEEVFKQTIDGAIKDQKAGQTSGAGILAFGKELARSGFVLGINGKPGVDATSAIIVVRNAQKSTWTDALNTIGRAAGKTEQITREDKRKLTIVRPSPSYSWGWWFEKDDLIVALVKPEQSVDTVAEVLSGKKPSASAHPLRSELTKDSHGFDPVLISFLDLAQLPPTPPALGLSGLKRIESRWGFQGEALVSIVRVVAPSPRKGLLALIDQPTFNVKAGLPLPSGVTDFAMISFSPLKMFDDASALAKSINPQTAPMIEQGTKMVEDVTGLKLREEILGRIGPKMLFYSTGEKVTIPASPYHSVAQWMLHLPKFTMLAEVKDEAGFTKSLDSLMTVANRQILAQTQNLGLDRTASFRPLKKGAKGYELDVPLGLFPLPASIRPTIRVDHGFVAFSTDTKAAADALAIPNRPLSPMLAKSFDGLPENLVMLAASDPSEYLPEILVNVPFFVQAIATGSSSDPSSPFKGIRLKIDHDQIPEPESLRKYLFPSSMSMSVDDQGLTLFGRDSFPSVSSASAAPVMAALLLPAVSSARVAAKRAQSTNNLKQIMLAYHNYHATFNSFPPAAITDGEGKPLLSWRVAILPYIEQQELYKEFHLDEPWDSAHNKPLIERMPAIYASTNVQPPTPFTTFYQTFVGPGALNDDKKGKGTGLEKITDGTSNTIAIAEAGTAVIWTKPDDIPFDPEKVVPKLGGLGFPGGANVGFCDGSVRFIKMTIDPDTLKALITKAGGEVINSDDF